ncbi:GntR family transcriptional regulator [Microbacterium sp. Au-Mic1]|uniref:GntR family transcriptional regulator n=1 Tax=Microbacterium sp. Au-Mic1 TaxID=2906457 RepID=UPI001E5B4A0F|nr:GntR family transcriptional regulator [Microbacterium sp. Au-Mic1]MCE4026224.1 GntR family transcriptional regulator [Microbacterium sp. Au-Mic1]
MLVADRPQPLWRQAVDAIIRDITELGLAEGMRLPTERDLCLRFDISRVTLRRALQQLVDDGVLTAHQGRGWFIAPAVGPKDWPNSLESFTETAHRMGLTASSRVLGAEIGQATLDEAEALGVAPGTRVFRVVRVRMLDRVPIAIDRALLPVSVAPDLLDVDWALESLYGVLEQRDVTMHRADSIIEARSASDETAAALDIAPGSPVLAMQQVVTDRDDRPVLLSAIEYVGDRYRLRTTFTRA